MMMTRKHHKLPRLASLLLFSMLTLIKLHGAAPQLSSEQPIEFDANTQSLVARGEAMFTHDEFVVIADEIRYYQQEERAEAIGNVRINQEGFRVVGQKLTYNVKTKSFSSEAFRAGNADLVAKGERFYGTPDDIVLENTRIYFQEPEAAAPYADAKKVRVINGKEIQVEELSPGLGSFHLFKLPVSGGSVDDPGLSFSGQIGYRNNYGAYLKTRTLLPVGNGLKLGTDLGLYSRRGILIGPDAEWDYKSENMSVHTELFSGYIHDGGDLGVDRLGYPVEEDRYYVTLRHKQHIGENIDITAKVDAWSDSEMLRDYDEGAFEQDEEASSFIEAVYRGKTFVGSVFSRFDPNEAYYVVKRQPEARLDLITSPIADTGIFHNGHIAVANMSDNLEDLNNMSYPLNLGADVLRFDAMYEWKAPLRLSNWATLTPMAGGRYTRYNQGAFYDDALERWMGEFGADLELQAYGEWDYKNKNWGINGLRHILKPVVQYRYITADEDGNDLIRPYDSNVFSTAIPIIDLNEMRNIDTLEDMHLVRFGVKNTLLTRAEKGAGSRELLHVNLYQDLNLDRQGDEPAWDAFYTQTVLSPANWLELAYETKTDTETLTMEDQLFRISLKSGDKWMASFYADNLNSQIEEYAFGGFYRINERFSAKVFLRWDALNDELIEQSYMLLQRVGHSWEIGYEISRDRHNLREDSTRFSMLVRLLQF